MSRHNERNPNLDPNMLLILLLILSAYSRKPIYYCDKELLNNQHNKASENNDVSRASDIGYTGGVLSEDDDSHYEADSNKSVNDNSLSSNRKEDTHYKVDKFDENKDEHIEADSNFVYHSSLLSSKERENHYVEKEYNKKNEELIKADALAIGEDLDKQELITMNLEFEDKPDCDDIVDSEIVPEYPNKLIIPEIDCNQVVVNVPVVLTQFEIEFYSETIIKLDYPAIEVKRSKKNVYLDECKLMPKANKLFLSGIVRKNIEYSAETNVRHVTVEVPFKCTTKVQYFTPPDINSNCDSIELETLRSDGMGNDITEKTFISSEKLNEKIYCKLVSYEINELDIADEDRREDDSPECEKLFETLTEKMVVKLNLKLIQEQQLNINK